MNKTHENVIIWSGIAFVIAACFVSLTILFTLAIKGMSVQQCPQQVPGVQTDLLTPTPSYLWRPMKSSQSPRKAQERPISA